ncbi:MAG: hypothetical protein ACO39X_03115, partial [Candidatus Nanopelagicaceae bacterium]
VNGSEELSSATTYTFDSSMTDINLGQFLGSLEQANMWIRAVALFDTRLSDAECEALTTL